MGTHGRLWAGIFTLVLAASGPGVTGASAQLEGEFGLLGGYASAPFDYDGGFFYGGFVDLPLIATEGAGVLQGQILVGLASSDDNRETLTTALLEEQEVRTDQRQLPILFGLKYRLDLHPRVQPFVLAGPGIVVNLNNPEPLVAGQVPVPPELQAREIPTGQGFFLAAGHAGGGVEFLLAPEISVGFEGRFILQEESNSNFGWIGGRLSFHF